MSEATNIDHAAIRTGQLLSIATLLAAFAFDRWEPVAALGVVFLITAISLSLGPFALIYRLLLRPLGLVQPDLRVDHAQPHRFGQAIGALSAALAAYLLASGAGTVGWALVWVLIGLTGVSFAGWCIGCFLYYQLNRLGLGGFFGRAPTDKAIFLGARPRKGLSRD